MFCGILEDYSNFCIRKKVVIKLFDFVSFPGSSSLGKNEKIFAVGFTMGRKKKKKRRCAEEETRMGYCPFFSPGHDIVGRVATSSCWVGSWRSWPGVRPSRCAHDNGSTSV